MHKARDAAVEAAQVAILDSGVDVSLFPLTCVQSSEVYFWPTRRRRDVRNAEASMKSYYDGFVVAGLLYDDDIEHLRHMPTRFEYDKHNPRVEVTLETL